jgi:two-component system response regulator FixJ
MTNAPIVFVIDDDPAILELVEFQLLAAGHTVKTFTSAIDFLNSDHLDARGCVLTDVRMPDMDGLQLQEELNKREVTMPVIIMTANADVSLAVRAMRAGAVDIVEKPFTAGGLRHRIQLVLDAEASIHRKRGKQKAVRKQLAALTVREKNVFELIIVGKSNKAIAEKLDISQRTVEVHRAKIMEKLNVDNVASLIRLALLG